LIKYIYIYYLLETNEIPREYEPLPEYPAPPVASSSEQDGDLPPPPAYSA
jgi:hypothetical protein